MKEQFLSKVSMVIVASCVFLAVFMFTNHPEQIYSYPAQADENTTNSSITTTSPSAIVSQSAITSGQAIDNVMPDVLQPAPITGHYYFFVINKETNRLTIYDNYVKYAVYSVASGTLSDGVSITPSGKWKVLTKVVNPAWGGGGYATPVAGGSPKNPLGHYWMGLSVNGTTGGSYGIHGNTNESSIGKNASHGCIRTHNYETPVLFKIAYKGMPVTIGTTAELTNWGYKDFE